MADGGQDYPEKVLREPKRNIRVWLQDGSEDMEQERYGSWPLANVRMANALKNKDYDFHFSFGKGTHNSGQGAAEFPDEMIWLWRDYDPGKDRANFRDGSVRESEARISRDGDESRQPVAKEHFTNLFSLRFRFPRPGSACS